MKKADVVLAVLIVAVAGLVTLLLLLARDDGASVVPECGTAVAVKGGNCENRSR